MKPVHVKFTIEKLDKLIAKWEKCSDMEHVYMEYTLAKALRHLMSVTGIEYLSEMYMAKGELPATICFNPGIYIPATISGAELDALVTTLDRSPAVSPEKSAYEKHGIFAHLFDEHGAVK